MNPDEGKKLWADRSREKSLNYNVSTVSRSDRQVGLGISTWRLNCCLKIMCRAVLKMWE